MKKLLLTISFFLLALLQAMATHNRAGEITYEHIQNLTYKITVTTYTYKPSPADRPELEIFWGDATSDTIPRDHFIDLSSVMRKNVYFGYHTYLAAGTFKISLEDPNRNGGVINIPNSVNTVFYIETFLTINPFFGPNSSPVLLVPPIDNACLHKPFIHNPGAYDKDGDSLSYKLVPCKGGNGLAIGGYSYPAASTSFSINATTGDLLWDSPIVSGEYNVAILVEEWRHIGVNIVKLGSVLRDMQINVIQCNNDPPIIADVKDTCVEAGSLIQFQVTATDINNDYITLTGTGGPLLLPSNPAIFVQPVVGKGFVSSVFSWQTTCNHVQKFPYTVTFKATDDGHGTPVKLVDIETFYILIVGPSPKNLTVNPSGITMHLNWNKSACTNALGYEIYRRNGYFGFFPGHCETGVPAYTGYTLIDKIQNIHDTDYVDNNQGTGLIHGVDYCYMVVAYYPDGAKSYASLEACATLVKDVPIITNVSINTTNDINGSAYIAWSKPTEFDSLQLPPPYKYLIYRSEGFSNTNYILIDSLSSINDTIYVDTFLNTLNYPYYYRIDFYSDTVNLGSTHIASSVFLSLTPGDNKLKLSWEENVPWTNSEYTIYKLNPTSLLFDSIGWTTNSEFLDSNLINGKDYCYKVKSKGNYTANGIINPIINFSQISCDKPIDLEKPCAPVLNVRTNCLLVENTLKWNNPNNSCADDVIQYEVYYSPLTNGDYTIITTIYNPTDTVYIHSGLTSIAGCYTIVAIDSFMNKSDFSNVVCIDIDSCDLYSLPNVFTPNGDGYNDFFIPFPYNFVDHIDLQILNRWGNIVFTTNDPDINWDGKNKDTHNVVPDGVYFFVCDVFEIRLEGLIKRTITGVVHVYGH